MKLVVSLDHTLQQHPWPLLLKNNKLFTLAQSSDMQCLWEVLRGMHQPLPVPSVALQQSSSSHLSSISAMKKWKMNIERCNFDVVE